MVRGNSIATVQLPKYTEKFTRTSSRHLEVRRWLGVYEVRGFNDKVIYVGRAKNLRIRSSILFFMGISHARECLSS